MLHASDDYLQFPKRGLSNLKMDQSRVPGTTCCLAACHLCQRLQNVDSRGSRLVLQRPGLYSLMNIKSVAAESLPLLPNMLKRCCKLACCFLDLSSEVTGFGKRRILTSGWANLCPLRPQVLGARLDYQGRSCACQCKTVL